MIWIGILIGCLTAGPVGFGLFALFAINGENKEIRRLKEFARYVIETECWSIHDLDGGNVQELAEKLGLIVWHTATNGDVDEDRDVEVGDSLYMFSELLKGQRP